jgi:hypothetical protein
MQSISRSQIGTVRARRNPNLHNPVSTNREGKATTSTAPPSGWLSPVSGVAQGSPYPTLNTPRSDGAVQIRSGGAHYDHIVTWSVCITNGGEYVDVAPLELEQHRRTPNLGRLRETSAQLNAQDFYSSAASATS